MALRRSAPRFTERSNPRPSEEIPSSDSAEEFAPAATPAEPERNKPGLIEPELREPEWPGEESAFLAEVLRSHGFNKTLVDALLNIAMAPANAPRLVDRLAVALAGRFHFLPLEDALRTPVLLYGAPGAGTSTLAAKVAARFDEDGILVISAGNRGGATAQLEENLEVLGVKLTLAPDARAVRSAVAHANGRAVIIDAGCGAPTEAAAAKQIRALSEAAQAEPALVLSAESPNDQAIALARAASRIGTRRLILTRLDTSRYLGTPLHAADEGQLALVAASVTPHFAFGLRVLAPENLARRILSAALRAERWRVAPF